MLPDRIVVTGANGFIGRHLVERLAGDGKALTIVVRDPLKCPDAWQRHARVVIVEVPDLTRPGALMPALEGASSVVHLAGLAHIARSDTAGAEAQFMRANAEVTQALVGAASQAGVAAFVNLSSLAAVTANVTESTIDDRSDAPPVTAYGRSKRVAEQHVAAFAAKGAFAISVRPPLVVGAEARGNWALLQRLAHMGIPLPFAGIANQRSFISVGTLCEAISALLSRQWEPRLSGNYCIADEERLSLPEIVRELRRGMGLPPWLFACPPAIFAGLGQLIGRRRQLAGLTGNLRVDASRFFATFAFKPAMPIREAVRQSGAAYAAAHR
jgi:UDP-N-acetyl-alpha-D-quinovosamine dehydrogenase